MELLLTKGQVSILPRSGARLELAEKCVKSPRLMPPITYATGIVNLLGSYLRTLLTGGKNCFSSCPLFVVSC